MIDNKAKSKPSGKPQFGTRIYDPSLGKPTAPPQATATPQRFPIPRSESPAQKAKAAYMSQQSPSMPASKPGQGAQPGPTSGPPQGRATGIMAKMGAPSAQATPQAIQGQQQANTASAYGRALEAAKNRNVAQAFGNAAEGGPLPVGLGGYAQPPLGPPSPAPDYGHTDPERDAAYQEAQKEAARQAYMKSLDMEGRLDEQLALDQYGIPDEALFSTIDSLHSGMDQDAAMAKAKQLAYMNQMGIGTSGMAMHGMGDVDAQNMQAKAELASKMILDNYSTAIQHKIAELQIAADLAKSSNQLDLWSELEREKLAMQKQAQLMEQATKGPEWVAAIMETWGLSQQDAAAYLADVQAAGGDQDAMLQLLGNFKVGEDEKLYYVQGGGDPPAPGEAEEDPNKYLGAKDLNKAWADEYQRGALVQEVQKLIAHGDAGSVYEALEKLGYNPNHFTERMWAEGAAIEGLGGWGTKHHGANWE